MTTVDVASPQAEFPVLVVDSDQAMRSRVVSALEEAGVSTVEATGPLQVKMGSENSASLD